MYKCECGREFKSKSGLTRHSNGCKAELKEEPIKEIEVVINEVDKTKELSEETQRKLKKLVDARNSCYDAKTKHDFEVEIELLKKG